MLFYKMILGILKRDPRFKPLDKTAVPFYDRIMEIIPSLNRKLPSNLSKFLFYRHYLTKYRSPLHTQILSIKTFLWKAKLHVSKSIQDTLYLSQVKGRKCFVFLALLFGLLIGDRIANTESCPGDVNWGFMYYAFPKVHWMLPYLIENVASKGTPDYFKKDNMTMGIDRMMLKGIEDKELDPLSWMVLGSKFASMQEPEFSYLAFQMAHFKDHQNIGGNSLQPIEGMEAARIFTVQQ